MNDSESADISDGHKKILLKMSFCQEWELEKEAEKVLAKGSHLAEVVYTIHSKNERCWRYISANFLDFPPNLGIFRPFQVILGHLRQF